MAQSVESATVPFVVRRQGSDSSSASSRTHRVLGRGRGCRMEGAGEEGVAAEGEAPPLADAPRHDAVVEADPVADDGVDGDELEEEYWLHQPLDNIAPLACDHDRTLGGGERCSPEDGQADMGGDAALRLETVPERYERLRLKYGEAAAVMLLGATQEGVEYDPVENVWRSLEGPVCPPLLVNAPAPESEPLPSLPAADGAVTAI